MSRPAALLALLLFGCGRDGSRATPAGSAGATAVPTVPAAPVNAGTAAAAPPRAVCPATGRWTRCAVLLGLDRAGLAPRVDSEPVSEPPLQPPGILVHLFRGDLELYVYPDSQARAQDERRLDPRGYLAYDAPQPMQPLPTLIRSVNLIAILHSRNDHLRERVSDAIMAGPPQPSHP